MYVRRTINTIFLLVLVTMTVRAQSLRTESKDFILHFRFDRSLVDGGYRNNSEALKELRQFLSDSTLIDRIDTIRIRAYSSPDGNESYNRSLARQRARAVKGYLVWQYPNLDQYSIRTDADVAEWEGLLPFIEKSNDMPCRDQVINILLSDAHDGLKEMCLKAVGGGNAYRYIQQYILPELRNTSVCTVYLKQPQFTGVLEGVRKEVLESPCRTDLLLPDTGVHAVFTPPSLFSGRKVLKPFIALKTNLLFDLAIVPNIELELPLGRGNRWSLNAEWIFPWWLIDDDKYCLQVLYGGVEGRYWLGNRLRRRSLTGHFLGFYAGAGKYDLQWKEDGYQGEFYIASGISYGYAAPIARRLNLEFSLGIGLLRTDYEHYHAIDNYQTLLWQNNGNYTWLGPTKLKISLVWLLGQKRKGGGEK